MRFTFNKKAKRTALQAMKHLETGSFASAVLGTFSTTPRTTALVALGLFVICRVCTTIIAGIENTDAKMQQGSSPMPEQHGSRRDESIAD